MGSKTIVPEIDESRTGGVAGYSPGACRWTTYTTVFPRPCKRVDSREPRSDAAFDATVDQGLLVMEVSMSRDEDTQDSFYS